VATCNGCGEAIDWVVTAGGKKMPVSAERLAVVVAAGEPLRVVLNDGRVVAARRATDVDLAAGLTIHDARTSHFATRSRAERFRAKGRTAP
jgi:hypothetical protein